MKAWTKGDRVVQATYGSGTLVEVNEHHTVIEFDEHGRRVFSTRLVALQASSSPAPSKTPRRRAVKAKVAPVDGQPSAKDAKASSKQPKGAAKEAKAAAKEAKA